jgi:hypothetical protein
MHEADTLVPHLVLHVAVTAATMVLLDSRFFLH